MAGPQKENGFTPVANEIIEKVIGTQFPATHLKVILMCWRYTYGFSRKEAKLSETYISKATGISKRYVSSAMKDLIDTKVLIVVKEPNYTSPRIIKFNKDYDQWECRSTVQQMKYGSTGEAQNSTTGEVQFNTTDELQFHQERKIKNNIKAMSEKNFGKESQEFILASKLYGLILENNPKAKKPNLNKWCSDFDLMLRVDDRSIEDVIRVMEWCQHDSFWKSNILSAGKLREKYDQLFLKTPQAKVIPVRRLIEVEEVAR